MALKNETNQKIELKKREKKKVQSFKLKSIKGD